MTFSNRNTLKKLRISAMLILAVSAVAFFWLIFRQIDRQLSDFNYYVLKTVNDDKSNMVQRELNSIERWMGRINELIENDQSAIIPVLLKNEPLAYFVDAIAYQLAGGKHEYFFGRDIDDSVLHSRDTVIFNSGVRPSLQFYKTIKSGILIYKIDLIKWHEYFEINSDGRTYFELYDQFGYCWMHPDISKVGLLNKEILKHSKAAKDTIVESDYLQLPVVRNLYNLQGLFSKNILYVSIPVFTVSDELENIVDFSLLLSISGIILMTVFLIVMNWQNQKTSRLALQNMLLEKEEALLRFENLKRKIDPHFLFNALGSLQQLIGKDSQLAQTFVGKMSRVYRKFLSVNDTGLSSIRDEIALAEEFFFLQQIRFGHSILSIEINVSSSMMTKQIPRFSLQILIENAIKHNEVSLENPLQIFIYLEDEKLCVSNSYSPRRKREESTGYGTKLIGNVYDFYKINGYAYEIVNDNYIVKLPFIEA